MQDLLLSTSIGTANNNDAATSSNSRQDATQREARLSVHGWSGWLRPPPHKALFCQQIGEIGPVRVDAEAEDNGYGFYPQLGRVQISIMSGDKI